PVASPEMQAALKAYAAGVNAYATANPLPPEYATLEITRFRPWTELDTLSIIKSIAFSLTFFDDVDRGRRLRTYQAAGAKMGFDGTKLYFEDTDRTEPFDPAAIVPDAQQRKTSRKPRHVDDNAAIDLHHINQSTLELAESFLERTRHIPFI